MKTSHISSIVDFRQFVSDSAFPCVGAKSALARKQVMFFIAKDIRSGDSDREITTKLQEFAQNQTKESLFVSFAVLFDNIPHLSEHEFEDHLWVRLQSVHEIDAENYAWDKKVSSDPESAHFSMSVGGKGFYVIGLHPNASRPARQLARPALIFNLHSQFELIRDQGSYAKIRDTILMRDTKLSGNENPMLAVHGESSEARQYSGRAVKREWKCPFHFLGK